MCLPDTGKFLEENGELLQTQKIQMWVFKEPGGHLEKVLTAAHIQKFIQVAWEKKKKETKMQGFVKQEHVSLWSQISRLQITTLLRSASNRQGRTMEPRESFDGQTELHRDTDAHQGT